MVRTVGGEKNYQIQDIAVLAEAAAIQNQYYTILNVENDAGILLEVGTAIDTANETLQPRFTIDGVTMTGGTFPGVVGTNTDCYMQRRAATGEVVPTLIAVGKDTKTLHIPFHNQCVVQIRKTTNAGAGTLYGVALYGLKR